MSVFNYKKYIVSCRLGFLGRQINSNGRTRHLIRVMAARDGHTQSKKISRQNSFTAMTIMPNSNIALQHGAPRSEQEERQFSFYDEISDIMRGFGDCNYPLRESVLLVEKILQQQMKGILSDAMDVAMKRRGNHAPHTADFEFLMRKHPAKINRMRKHIEDQKLLRRLQNRSEGRVEEADGSQESDEENEAEVAGKYDEEKTRRMFRADRISQILSGEQYSEFNEARRTSFYCRHSEKMKVKFEGFLCVPSEIQLSKCCMNILAYLAHETVATVVDYAILTRLHSGNRITEPYSRVTPSGTSYNMLHVCPEVSQGRGQDGIKPITPHEIHEAIRRNAQVTRKGFGFYRNTINSDMRQNYLAI